MAEQPMSREEIETLIRRHNCSSCKPDTPPRMVRWECKTKRALRQLLREVDEAKTALADYSSHQGTCLRSYWQAGEVTRILTKAEDLDRELQKHLTRIGDSLYRMDIPLSALLPLRRTLGDLLDEIDMESED